MTVSVYTTGELGSLCSSLTNASSASNETNVLELVGRPLVLGQRTFERHLLSGLHVVDVRAKSSTLVPLDEEVHAVRDKLSSDRRAEAACRLCG